MSRILFFFLFPLAAFAAQPDSRPVLVIVGMDSEAKIAAGPGAMVVISAGNASLLRSRLAHLSRADVRAVVSFGIAGGLNPALKAGDAFVAGKVLAQGAALPADSSLAKIFTKAAKRGEKPARAGLLLGQDTVVAVDPASRKALRAATGADLDDTESHAAAEFAAHEGLPFGFVRAVADPASLTLPPAALIPLLPNGKPDGKAIFESILKNPFQLGGLVEVAIDSGTALGTLRAIRSKFDWAKIP